MDSDRRQTELLQKTVKLKETQNYASDSQSTSVLQASQNKTIEGKHKGETGIKIIHVHDIPKIVAVALADYGIITLTET